MGDYFGGYFLTPV